MDEAKRLLDETRKVESEQRRQRQEIFAVEDEIEARRDALIAAVEKRLHRASHARHFFTIRWEVACRIAEMRFWRHVDADVSPILEIIDTTQASCRRQQH
jgi:hypothetical protein